MCECGAKVVSPHCYSVTDYVYSVTIQNMQKELLTEMQARRQAILNAARALHP
jgi:hypothetical protein